MSRRTLLALTSAALLAMPVAMSGCLVSRSKEVSYSGSRIDYGELSKVRINQSTTTEVESLLGPPTTTADSGEGTETWTWNWRKRTEGEGRVFLLFSGEKSKSEEASVHIKFRDGIAVDKWRG